MSEHDRGWDAYQADQQRRDAPRVEPSWPSYWRYAFIGDTVLFTLMLLLGWPAMVVLVLPPLVIFHVTLAIVWADLRRSAR